MAFNPFAPKNPNSPETPAVNPFAPAPASDERLTKRADGGEARTERADSDRPVTQNREVTDIVRGAERRAILRDTNTLLPAPPAIEGYHSFWATTTNPKDTIEQRQRLGYTFITRAEAPGFELSTLKSSDSTADRIMINEMVAMKIPLDIWQEDMIDIHHTEPTTRAKGLRDIKFSQDGRGRSVAYTGEGFTNGVSDGYADLGRAVKPNLKGVA